MAKAGIPLYFRVHFRVLAALIFLLCIPAQSKIRYLLDFDGTLVNDDGDDAGWQTPWILKRIEELHTSLQPRPGEPVRAIIDGKEVEVETPDLMEVSYKEYRRILARMAKKEGMLGDFSPVALDRDPAQPDRPAYIIPGLYRVSDDLTYKYHREGLKGENWFLRDYKLAKKRQELSKGKLQWTGLAFPLLQAGLNDSTQVDSVVLFSARSQVEPEFLEWLNALKKDGLVSNVIGKDARGKPIKPRAHFLKAPEGILYGRDLENRKVRVLTEEAMQLLTAPFALHEELVTDEIAAAQGKTASLHTLIVAENDPGYIVALSKELERLSGDLHISHRIKFVLLNAGLEEDISQFRWPWRWTVFDGGIGRKALPEELRLWAKFKPGKSCEALLAGERIAVKRRAK